MITYQEETFNDIYEDIKLLISSHEDEINMFGKDIPLNPNWDKYKELYDLGLLSIITIRKDLKLVGYYISIIFKHLHYDTIIACNDMIYIIKKYRGLIFKFFIFIQEVLKAKKVTIMSFSITPKKDFRKVAEFAGFELLEYNYFKRLDKWHKP